MAKFLGLLKLCFTVRVYAASKTSNKNNIVDNIVFILLNY